MYIANSKGKKKDNGYAKKEEGKKSSVKTTKGRKRVEDKNRNKEQGQQIENSNGYGGY